MGWVDGLVFEPALVVRFSLPGFDGCYLVSWFWLCLSV